MLLTNKTYTVKGDRYKTRAFFLENFPSVIEAYYFDITGDIGNWDGYIIQKHSKNYFLIRFSQENKENKFKVRTASNYIKFSDLKEKYEAIGKCIDSSYKINKDNYTKIVLK